MKNQHAHPLKTKQETIHNTTHNHHITNSTTLSKDTLEDYIEKWKKTSINETKKNIFTESLNNNKLLEANLKKEGLNLKKIEVEAELVRIKEKIKEFSIEKNDEKKEKIENLKKEISNIKSQLQEIKQNVSKNDNPNNFILKRIRF